MMLQPDLLTGRQRIEDMQREAAQYRLAREAALHAGKESLLSRMAKLFTGFGGRLHQPALPQAKLHKQRLASAKPR